MKNSLTSLLRDPKGNFRVKIAAASALMYYPTGQGMEQLRHVLASETNLQVRQFLTSSFQTMATSQNPNTQHL